MRNILLRSLGLSLAILATSSVATADDQNQPPKGFTALFNGKDFAGWHGMPHFDPRKLAEMSDDARAAQIKTWTEESMKHWSIKEGVIINDGAGPYLTTDKDYRDFELHVDYSMDPKGDSGIYLKANPQVQIWDYTEEGGKWNLGADKGSGGLWNNSPGKKGKDPLVLADKPFGEWNHFRIIQVGATTTVYLNDKLVVDHAIMENYFDRDRPPLRRGPHPASNPRRRDPLAEHLPQGTLLRRGQRLPLRAPQGLHLRLRRQGPQGLGRRHRQLRGRRRSHPLQARQGRRPLLRQDPHRLPGPRRVQAPPRRQ